MTKMIMFIALSVSLAFCLPNDSYAQASAFEDDVEAEFFRIEALERIMSSPMVERFYGSIDKVPGWFVNASTYSWPSSVAIPDGYVVWGRGVLARGYEIDRIGWPNFNVDLSWTRWDVPILHERQGDDNSGMSRGFRAAADILLHHTAIDPSLFDLSDEGSSMEWSIGIDAWHSIKASYAYREPRFTGEAEETRFKLGVYNIGELPGLKNTTIGRRLDGWGIQSVLNYRSVEPEWLSNILYVDNVPWLTGMTYDRHLPTGRQYASAQAIAGYGPLWSTQRIFAANLDDDTWRIWRYSASVDPIMAFMMLPMLFMGKDVYKPAWQAIGDFNGGKMIDGPPAKQGGASSKTSAFYNSGIVFGKEFFDPFTGAAAERAFVDINFEVGARVGGPPFDALGGMGLMVFVKLEVPDMDMSKTRISVNMHYGAVVLGSIFKQKSGNSTNL